MADSIVGCVAAGLIAVPLFAQTGRAVGEWPTWGGDLAATRYAPLDQINATNFNQLEMVWRFRTESLGPRPEYNLQTTPLVVNRRMYITAGSRRTAVALDPATGEMLWMHRLYEEKRAENASRVLSGRGVAYWSDGEGKDERVFYVTIGYQLVALDAKTGRPIQGFGTDGVVDLKRDFDQAVDPDTGDVGLHSAPIVVNDVIVIGAAHATAMVPPSRANVKGYVRGFDVRTGKLLWTFHTVPRPGEFGVETWENDSASYTGNTGVWAQMSADEELGLVYLPVELATGDVYGGDRPGDNLFSESIVAVDARTGQRRWHFQVSHHGIWDRDLPAAPILGDITVAGRRIKALVQLTKQGFAFVLDRVTGEPVWPIEERPVEQSTVPGEKTSPTQPFPTKPPAYDRQGLTVDDLIDFTPDLHAEALKVVSRYKLGQLYTPPVLSQWEGPLAVLTTPGFQGAAKWPGGSFDPETGMLYVFSESTVALYSLVAPQPGSTDVAYVWGFARPPAAGAGGSGAPRPTNMARGLASGPSSGAGGPGNLSVQGLPLLKPPYGRISAIDLSTGEMRWQVAHGDTPDLIKNHPALKGVTIPPTGRPGNVGTLVTKTLLIAGEGGTVTTPSGRRGAMLRAYDKATGEEVGAVYLPAPVTGPPMTFLLNGQQYLSVAVGGTGYPAELLTFKLGT